ncbi:unnamed protein product [Zymoseptoria tritici ST99CH_1E4]|uniref:Nephrocystin 3-like N-terminal domain-containing protein n=1 Tax=Zymoseptoria tritici ST99CH_1E4 TaxID=1276532 RepID=A0A2H1H0T0_ZYMTR|nr:unnamed protein product [Zymoseptoria tritici ST99CH_1E4]
MASEQPLRADSYTVAWLCALPIEQAAALLMLDERHQEPDGFHQFLRDDNVYSWGRIAKHNIVIASLPDGEYGLVSAAVTVSGLRASLPHIRIGLMVGIGAGIPWIGDVLLGDVVVSSPDGKSGGVAQYDLYKAKVSSGVATKERKGFLASPPRALRNAIESLKADHEFQDSKLEHFMQVFQRHKKTKVTYGYPGNDKDPLRAELGTEARPHPEIRYGIIASGNRLIKNAQERDEVLEWLSNENIKPICFEMEAASLMNSFPCLVIRGICDYADEHKNDVWQRYAAGTAAAFAKELLGYVRPADVVISPQIGDLVDTENNIQETVQKTEQTVRDFHASAETQRILDWLCPTDYSKQFTDLSRQHSAGTAEWFLQHPHFQQWALSTNASALFCPGDPGTGKTVISTLAIHYLLHSSGAAGQVAYIFCDYAQRDAQTFEHLLSAVLRQLSCDREGNAAGAVEALYRHHKPSKTRPRPSELQRTIETVLKASGITHLVVDALDECEPQACKNFIAAVKALPNLALLATSRHVPVIEKAFEGDSSIEMDKIEDDAASVASVETTFSTASTLDGTEVTDDLIERFVELLFYSRDLNILYLTASRDPAIGLAKIRTNLRRLIVHFGKDLGLEATQKDERGACRLLRSSTLSSRAAMAAVERALEIESQDSRDSAAKNIPKYVLSDNDHESPRRDRHTYSGDEMNDAPEEDDEEDEDDPQDNTVNEVDESFVTMKEFMMHSKAYSTFCLRLLEFVVSPHEKRIWNAIGMDFRVNGKQVLDHQTAQNWITELSFVPYKEIRVLDHVHLGLLDELQGRIEDMMGESWQWWPVGPRKHALLSGHRRYCWTSPDGEENHIDVAATAEQSLTQVLSQAPPLLSMPQDSSGSLPLGMNNIPANSGNARLSTNQIKTQQTGHSPSSASGDSPRPSGLQSGASAAGSGDSQQPLLVYLCVHQWGDYRFPTIDVLPNTLDHKFFVDLRKNYLETRGFLCAWFSFFRYDHCKFLEFQSHHYGTGEPTKLGYPLPTDKEYSFTPRPTVPCPPLHRHAFNRYFYNPRRPMDQKSNSWRNLARERLVDSLKAQRFIIEQMPKKKRRVLLDTGHPETFWGLLAVERRSFAFLLAYILLFNSPGFIFFFLWLF